MSEESGSDRGRLWELAATNRERIVGLERELDRQRDRIHEVASMVTGLRLSLEPLKELPVAMDKLADQLDALARRALERPTPGGLSAAASWVAAVTALVALVVALTR